MHSLEVLDLETLDDLAHNCGEPYHHFGNPERMSLCSLHDVSYYFMVHTCTFNRTVLILAPSSIAGLVVQ